MQHWWLVSCCVLCLASHAINNCCPALHSAEVISMEATSLVTGHLISRECNSGTVLFIYSWNMVFIILVLMLSLGVHLYLVAIHPGGKNNPSYQCWNRLWLYHRSKIFNQKGLLSFALTLYPLQEWTKNHTRRLRNPSLPSLFPSHDSLRCFLHLICSQYIHQGPPSNNVLAEAAVTHRGLNELCPSVLHSPSSIIHLSQGGTEVFRGFSLRNEITTLLKNAPLPRTKIDHKNVATHWTLSVLRIMRNVT